jgi:hypothetical protein
MPPYTSESLQHVRCSSAFCADSNCKYAMQSEVHLGERGILLFLPAKCRLSSNRRDPCPWFVDARSTITIAAASALSFTAYWYLMKYRLVGFTLVLDQSVQIALRMKLMRPLANVSDIPKLKWDVSCLHRKGVLVAQFRVDDEALNPRRGFWRRLRRLNRKIALPLRTLQVRYHTLVEYNNQPASTSTKAAAALTPSAHLRSCFPTSGPTFGPARHTELAASFSNRRRPSSRKSLLPADSR